MAAEAPSPDRELIGYGRSGIAVEWPDRARVAINLVVNYEEGSERSFWAGDGRNEAPNELGYELPPIRDLANESIFEYGSRAGIWRLQRLFDELRLQVTFFGCAIAFELNPEVGAYIAEAGHDVCCHGLRWEDVSRLDRETEKEHLLRAIDSIQKTCGERPRGWYAKAPPSLSTRELLVEEGGFLYDSDSFADDLPYFVQVLGRRHLVIPYSFVTNDSRYLPGQGFATPSDFLDNCRRAFNLLWREGETRPKMMSVGLHPRWMGQPARASALREFLEHALAHEGVWFARRIDIAHWWLENHQRFET
jgi:peptidoglycan/xylan/chitin deacetylase (PgdA/CDA1 family)